MLEDDDDNDDTDDVDALPQPSREGPSCGIMLRLRSHSDNDDRKTYYPVGQESTTALGDIYSTTAWGDDCMETLL